jgi:hypothetical protein
MAALPSGFGVQLKYGDDRWVEAEAVAGFLIDAELSTKPGIKRTQLRYRGSKP